MNLETIILISELLASMAVIATLVYLAKQVKQSARICRAASRHSLSEFVWRLTKFRAEHADRWIKVMQDNDLSSGEVGFRMWNHTMLLLRAETYFHHCKLKLMRDNHWRNDAKFINAALNLLGFIDYWNEVGFAFFQDFSVWMNHTISHSKLNLTQVQQ